VVVPAGVAAGLVGARIVVVDIGFVGLTALERRGLTIWNPNSVGGSRDLLLPIRVAASPAPFPEAGLFPVTSGTSRLRACC
jgi:hypothetical protein